MKNKFYSIKEIIKMLPYIQSYSKDIKKTFLRLKTLEKRLLFYHELITQDKKRKVKIKNILEKIGYLMKLHLANFLRWAEELKKMHMSICCENLGRIDVPIYDDKTKCVLVLCIDVNTTKKNIEWHFPNQTAEQAHPFWYKSKEPKITA